MHIKLVVLVLTVTFVFSRLPCTLGGPHYSCLTSYTYTVYATLFISCLMGTYIYWVLLFAWVLLFKKWIATGFMGTYIYRVLVFDGYLYSRVYGIDL